MSKKQSISKFLLATIVILVIAVVVRFVGLSRIPASLYYDEIDFGYQLKSLLTTGKDYRGVLSPFYFRSFNTDRTPFPIYFSTLTAVFFRSPVDRVRAGSALAGTICVILGMTVAFQLTRKKFYSLIVGVVFALSPWLIQFSRIAFESIYMLMVYLATISVFLHWHSSKKQWAFYLSAFLLGLNIYTYRTMSLFAPLTGLVFLTIYFKDFLKQGIVKVGLWLFIVSGSQTDLFVLRL